MWQTAGKAPVKPCALFCCVGGITINGTKTRCKRLYRAVLQQDKNKSPAPSADARQKKSPVITDRVKCFLFGRFEQRRKKPEEKQDTGKYHFRTSLYPLRRQLLRIALTSEARTCGTSSDTKSRCITRKVFAQVSIHKYLQPSSVVFVLNSSNILLNPLIPR